MSRSFCCCTGGTNDLDHTSKIAIILSAMVIFTTIQAQDFQDVAGDQASNRITFPIYAPEFSRFFTLLTIPLWSITLCWFWNIGWSVGAVYVGLGGYVGARYYCSRSQEADKKSYIIFNVRGIILSTTFMAQFWYRSGSCSLTLCLVMHGWVFFTSNFAEGAGEVHL